MYHAVTCGRGGADDLAWVEVDADYGTWKGPGKKMFWHRILPVTDERKRRCGMRWTCVRRKTINNQCAQGESYHRSCCRLRRPQVAPLAWRRRRAARHPGIPTVGDALSWFPPTSPCPLANRLATRCLLGVAGRKGNRERMEEI